MTTRIVHISDTHGKHNHIKIPECDILICSGDISPLGEKHSIDQFLKWFNKQTQATHRVFIAGNHDRSLDPKFMKDMKSNEWLPELFHKHRINTTAGWVSSVDSSTYYLEDTSVDIMGIKIWGSPWTPWFHGDRWAFNLQRGYDIEEKWKMIPHDSNIVVTHGPAFGYCDLGYENRCIGCNDLRYHLKRVKPLIHLSGHIHEAYGYEETADTHYFNGAICTLSYEPINLPWVIDADFGEKTIKIINHGNEESKVDEIDGITESIKSE